ncbi:M23 family metallopeptidase [Candidatus Margulisiibacteriota bacterium]
MREKIKKMLYQQKRRPAKRLAHRRHWSLILVPPQGGKNTSLLLNTKVLSALTIIAVVATLYFQISSGILASFEKQLTKYKEITTQHKKQEVTLESFKKDIEVLKKRITSLKSKDREIRKLLSLKPPILSNQGKYRYRFIKTRSLKNGTIGTLIINNKTILKLHSLPDDSINGYTRVQKLANNIIEILDSHGDFDESVIKIDYKNNCHIYVNNVEILKATERDLKKTGQNQLALAEKWQEKITEAVSSIMNLNSRNKLSRWFFGNSYAMGDVNQLSSRASLPRGLYKDSIQNNPNLLSMTESIEYIRKEISDRDNSLNNLKESVYVHVNRFNATPSRFPSYGRRVSSGFGWRRHPILRRLRFHTGVDLPGQYGDPIFASAEGEVNFSGWKAGYGRTVKIDHGYNLETLYGHCSKLLVRNGQKISKGQMIARVGKTGMASGSHVHYEIRRFNNPINPRGYLNLNIFTASKFWK